jgi:hypothetical protein
MGTKSPWSRRDHQRVVSGAGPYRLLGRAEGAKKRGGREPRDAEESVLLGLFALGSGPRAAAALMRGETFGVEVTLCAAVFVTSAALLVRAFFRRRVGPPHEGECP